MDWNKNDYETPNKEAALMAKLVLPTDRKILEPFAGTGQLVKALLANQSHKFDLITHEKNWLRFKKLIELKKHHDNLFCGHINFFGIESFTSNKFDLIITNPPFDYAMQGIKRSLVALNDKPESRLLFLLPLSFFSSQKRSKEFNQLDCHISHQYIIPGRIDYLKDGVSMSKCQKEIDGVPQFKNGKPVMCSGRQVSDAVFEIKKGKNPDSPISFL